MADTKERILLAALRLFAAEGYEAVSVSDIAGALGMTKGALYRHYRNKRDIFDSILERMARRDAAQASAHRMPEAPAAEAPDAYRGVSIDDMVDFGKAMFRYWTQDDFAAPFRRMLTLEQFRSAEMGKLYQQYLASGPLDYMADLLAGLDLPRPRLAAARFYAPMFFLYSVCDGAADAADASAMMDEILEDMRDQLREQVRKVRGEYGE